MATTTRVSSAWHYGSIAGTSWVTPTTYVYTGGTSPNYYMARQTFTSQARIDDIGPITGMRIYTDTLNSSTNSGEIYVSSTALAPNAVKTSGKKIGDWATPNGDPFWMTLTNFNAANLIAGIGSATTWYCYWINVVTASRSFYRPTDHPTWEITHTPGLVSVYNGTSWVSGTPYVWNGSTWVRGMAYVWNGSTWKLGLK